MTPSTSGPSSMSWLNLLISNFRITTWRIHSHQLSTWWCLEAPKGVDTRKRWVPWKKGHLFQLLLALALPVVSKAPQTAGLHSLLGQFLQQHQLPPEMAQDEKQLNNCASSSAPSTGRDYIKEKMEEIKLSPKQWKGESWDRGVGGEGTVWSTMITLQASALWEDKEVSFSFKILCCFCTLLLNVVEPSGSSSAWWSWQVKLSSSSAKKKTVS